MEQTHPFIDEQVMTGELGDQIHELDEVCRDPLLDLPYGRELDSAVREILEVHPSGINLRINRIIDTALGEGRLTKASFHTFLTTMLTDRRVRSTDNGLYRIQPIGESEASSLEGNDTEAASRKLETPPEVDDRLVNPIIFRGNIDGMLRVIMGKGSGAKSAGRSRNASRKRPHYKRTMDM